MGRGKDVWWATTAFVKYQEKNAIVKKDGLAEGYTICCTKTIAADIPTCFNAWSDDQTSQWYGNFKAKTADWGTLDESGNQNEFIRIRENKDLRLTWQTANIPHQTQADVTFTDKGKGKTLITLTHTRIQNREEADGLRHAWNESFDKLKSVLEK